MNANIGAKTSNADWIKRIKKVKIKHPTEYRRYLIVPINKVFRIYNPYNKFLRKVDSPDSAYIFIEGMIGHDNGKKEIPKRQSDKTETSNKLRRTTQTS